MTTGRVAALMTMMEDTPGQVSGRQTEQLLDELSAFRVATTTSVWSLPSLLCGPNRGWMRDCG